VVKIPEKFIKKNVFIQITSTNKTASCTHFSAQLKVQILERYGQVKVTGLDDKPLCKVYVKTFVKMKDSKVVFYKDGYTDLRGRFDYASVNSANELNKIAQFSIFVCSDSLGSMIKEANPPKTLARMEKTLVLKTEKLRTYQM